LDRFYDSMRVHRENLGIAFRSIKGNMTRSIVTMLIIAMGITALVSIFTATEALKGSVNSNFSKAGSDTFQVSYREQGIRMGRQRRKSFPTISNQEGEKYQQSISTFATTSLYFFASGGQKIEYKEEEANNVSLFGADENFFNVKSRNIEFGRNFSKEDNIAAKPYVIIASDLAKKLFPKGKAKGVGKSIKLGAHKYIVIGIIEPQAEGNGFSVNQDAYIPFRVAKKNYSYRDSQLRIESKVKKGFTIPQVKNEAIVAMRKVRKLRPKDLNNFTISNSKALLETITGILDKVGLATSSIGILTLLGAAVALMNIMLVSVTERTKEIGIRKSLGASSQHILVQFLTEAVVISVLGGILGIVFGIMIGNIVAIFLKSPFVIPWIWMLLAVLVCIIVGVISGFYPAQKASAYQPVDALRHV
jgi:putative ABC transport system permease protein